MAEQYPELLEVLVRQFAQDIGFNGICAEYRLILLQTKVSEPRPDIDGLAPAGHSHMIGQAGQPVQANSYPGKCQSGCSGGMPRTAPSDSASAF